MNEITRLDLNEMQRTAKILCASGYFVKGATDAEVAQMAVKIMAGQEIGFPPFTAVQSIHVIQGKPALSANLMASMVKAHPAYDYRVKEMTGQVVSLEFFEHGESLGLSTFTAEDAKKAGTQNMQKFPRNMMFARAMSNGVKWFCPDVLMGQTAYTPEELGARVDEEGNVLEGASFTVVDDSTPIERPEEVIVEDGDTLFSMDEVQEIDPNPLDSKEVRTSAMKAFHATGNDMFGTEWSSARAWMIVNWTEKKTPDNKRGSAADLTTDELNSIRNDMNNHKDALLQMWLGYRDEIIQKITQHVEGKGKGKEISQVVAEYTFKSDGEEATKDITLLPTAALHGLMDYLDMD